jgi:phosphatidylserine synthase
VIPNGSLFPYQPARVPAGGRQCEDRSVVPADIHDFFAASAGVAGALIGLLFVAISVTAGRLARAEATSQIPRLRAYGALVAFTNALTVSLWALLPNSIGTASLVVAILGLLFIAASLLSLIRLRQLRATARDSLFLVFLAVLFVWQLVSAINVTLQSSDSNAVENIATVVIACFLIGIFRAWDLIGGPSIGFRQEVVAMVRAENAERAERAGNAERAENAERTENGTGTAASPSGSASESEDATPS